MVPTSQPTIASPKATLRAINPATQELLGEVPIMDEDEVKQQVDAAWNTFESWRLTSLQDRIKKLLHLRAVIEQEKDELARLISAEVGKPLAESYLGDLSGPLDMCAWLAEKAPDYLKDQAIKLSNPLLSTKQNIITFEPLGVVGIISPWNYPFSIPMMTALMAVVLGNTVVLKPSEKSSLTGIKIGELFQSAGFPANVVSVVTGDARTGEYLSGSRLAKLVFTGSATTGAKVMAKAACRLTPVCLELGGKDAAIVLADTPTEWTARGLVWGAFTNAGQACASIERVYIVKGKKTDQLIEKLVAITKSLHIGKASEVDNDIGPLIDQGQFEKVVSQVDEAVKQGAKILCGGKRVEGLSGYFLEPTILTNVDQSMRIMTEETFGPVLPVMVVSSKEEAIKFANDSEYGLTASIWSKDLSIAADIAHKLKAGIVYINDALFSHAVPELPWGGLGKSGFGRSHCHFGLLDLVNIKHISKDFSGGLHRIWWYPYGPNKVQLLRSGLESIHGHSLFQKGKGLCNFLAAIFRR